ncbi:hypothetical protein BV129_01381B, partial [Haemophilus influenzae]
ERFIRICSFARN